MGSMKPCACCLVPIATLAVSVSPAASQDFGPEQVITQSTSSPRSVYTADLDGDGDEDVLSASYFDGKIAWYENLGGGLFGTQQIISTVPRNPVCVHAIDLDGDGDADVLSASWADNTLAWYENQGGGSFGPQQVITTAADFAQCVYAVDLDGDGDADVLSAAQSVNSIAWYRNRLNSANQDFGPQNVITTEADNAYSVYATDLDGDGDADVLSASVTDDKVAWYENLGGGSFGPQQVITTDASAANSVHAVDLDGDGDADVLSASWGDDKIAWYENLGGGSFGPQQVLTTDAVVASHVYATDLDGDGDVDVLSASFDDKIAWYENLGGGSFAAQQVITTAADGASCVYAADLDGDGDPDVLSAGTLDNEIAWHENLMGTPNCNVTFCDNDADNLGDLTLSTCDCSGGSMMLDLSTTFTGQFTYPLVGLGTTAVSPTGISELCLAGSTIGRYSKDAGPISASGTFSVDLLNAASAPGGGVPTIGGSLCNGNTWRFQYWHRDGMNPSRFSRGIAGLIN
jgi:hypothetical protein